MNEWMRVLETLMLLCWDLCLHAIMLISTRVSLTDCMFVNRPSHRDAINACKKRGIAYSSNLNSTEHIFSNIHSAYLLFYLPPSTPVINLSPTYFVSHTLRVEISFVYRTCANVLPGVRSICFLLSRSLRTQNLSMSEVVPILLL